MNIVAATDFSEHAGYAAHRAALLAAQHGARLELLHVVAKAPLDALRELFSAKPEGVANLVDDLRHVLTGAAAALAAKTGAPIASRVEIGEALDAVALECDRADLLVVGARGTNPLRDAILGTTAERLLGKCRHPMLVVKRPPARAYEKLLLAIDFSPPSEKALQVALRLAPRAAVMAVHAYDIPFEGRLRMASVTEEIIEAYGVRAAEKAIGAIQALGEQTSRERGGFVHAVDRGNPSRLILEKERDFHADLIVMGRRARPVAEALLLGSVTRHVLGNCASDVLVVPG
jgi:nucleotide-binding universal stress UspA family protein